jgi:nitrogen regulatory protein PII
MHFKLVVALVEDSKTEAVLEAARAEGATGVTVIPGARGEGLEKEKTFFGLNLTTPRDVLMFLVEEHLSRRILERIREVGEFKKRRGMGIAFQIDVEDTVGVGHQAEVLKTMLGDEL